MEGKKHHAGVSGRKLLFFLALNWLLGSFVTKEQVWIAEDIFGFVQALVLLHVTGVLFEIIFQGLCI